VGADGKGLTVDPQLGDALRRLRGTPFFKMTGSGNDFVIFDSKRVDAGLVTSPEVIRTICHRRNGIGADGIVLMSGADTGDSVTIEYFNADGTPADLCGNATLCATALAATIGLGSASSLRLRTGAGDITARVVHTGPDADVPEIDVPEITALKASQSDIALVVGESHIGFAIVGVPHLVVRCDDADRTDLDGRGPILRHHASLGEAGANVNWVSSDPRGGWRYRTFERGVEGETLACGTGAIACAALLATWGAVPFDAPVRLWTSSGLPVSVRLRRGEPEGPPTAASLAGEGRLVYSGRIERLS
jgi:diaminopimelate epimerase